MDKNKGFFNPLNPVWLNTALVVEVIIVIIVCIGVLITLFVDPLTALLGMVGVVVLHVLFMLSLNLAFNIQQARMNTDDMKRLLLTLNKTVLTLVPDQKLEPAPENTTINQEVKKKAQFKVDMETVVKTFDLDDEQNMYFCEKLNNRAVQIMYEHKDGHYTVVDPETDQKFKVNKDDIE